MNANTTSIQAVASRLAKGEDVPMRRVPVATRTWLVDQGLAVEHLNFAGYLGSRPRARHRLANIGAGEPL